MDRLGKYARVSWIELADAKRKNNATVDDIRKMEAELVLKDLKPNTFLIGLDEKGKEMSSRNFSEKLNYWTANEPEVAFLIGGAYGFHDKMYHRMNEKLALSQMTLSHQMVRLLLAEQLYRAYSILNGEPYHND